MINNIPTITPPDHTKDDMISKTKSLYDASFFEIFWRNFLAGFSKTLGAIFIYFLFIFLMGLLFFKLVFPIISPLLNKLTGMMDSLSTIQKIQTTPQQIIPKGFDQLLFPNK
jgi:hypothetical protein